MENINVKKRNGTLEPFDPEKIHRMVEWAIEGIPDVNLSDIEINAKLNYSDGITTKNIHEILIDSAANLITLKTPNYQIVAARLLEYQLRKDIWGGKNPPKLIHFIHDGVFKHKIYDPEILTKFSEDEINKLDDYINHDRDYRFNYAGIRQLCDKYIIQDRHSKKLYETPQFVYMLISMVCFMNYSKQRINYIKRCYDYFSKFKINLPTPIMAGVRGTKKSFASCCLIDVADDKYSILHSNAAAGLATCDRCGIGLNVGRIRSKGESVSGGSVIHTGLIPFLKMYESTVKSLHQNGLRGGGATVNVPFWHPEILDIMVLKNNAGTDENRVRKLDYVIQFSKIFYERLKDNKPITLFSPHEVPELIENFGLPGWDELYKKAEKNPKLKTKIVVPMQEFRDILVKETIATARIYKMNIDHCNEHGPFDERVTMTNLCVEVTHPVKPLYHPDDPEAEIGVCILSAINVYETSESELEKVCDVVVRILDELIDYQEYFLPAAERFTKNWRSLGIGITNLAALMAKKNIQYDSPDAPNFVARLMEKIQYYLIKASVELAKEKGPCPYFSKTKYAKGILPIDTYKKTIDKVVTEPLAMDWEHLRKEILEHGMRHSSLTSMMPCESSSVIQTSTNGIEPIRRHRTYKTSKAGSLPVIVPDYQKIGKRYTIAWELKDNIGIININAALQKFVDMAISTNLYYNYENYPDNRIPDSVVVRDLLYAYSMGLKTIYYTNTPDGDLDGTFDSEKVEEDRGCESGACAI